MGNRFSKRDGNVISAVVCVKCKTSCECVSVGAGTSLYQRKYSLLTSHAAILLLFAFTLLNGVQSATQITGTVLDADTKAPLKNAIVSLKSTGDMVLTNDSGAFTLTKTEVSIIKTSKITLVAPFILNRNQLQLNILNPSTPVLIVILNLSGQVVYKTTKILQSGFQSIDLSKSLSTNSTYILQLKINQKNYTTKILPLAVRPSGSPLVFSSSSPLSSHSIAISSPDTLIVSKYLYNPQITPLTAKILLQKPSTPPTPPGMKAIPGGKYLRGSNHAFSDIDERPIIEITISPFYIDSSEVIQADYVSLLCIAPWLGYHAPNGIPYPGKGNNYPVWNVNWYDAAYYCNARSKRDSLDTVYIYDSISGVGGNGCVLLNIKTDFNKNGYRMPTESEWEYAARGGTTTEYYWGNYSKNDLITPTKYAWYATNVAHPVSMKIPNNFGLYDMAGNVLEYVNDYYDGFTYRSDETIDPKGPTSDPDDERCLRGGSWDLLIGDIRPAARMGFAAKEVLSTDGFRVVLPNK